MFLSSGLESFAKGLGVDTMTLTALLSGMALALMGYDRSFIDVR